MNVLQLQTHMGNTALVSGGNVLATNYKKNQNIEGNKQLGYLVSRKKCICMYIRSQSET